MRTRTWGQRVPGAARGESGERDRRAEDSNVGVGVVASRGSCSLLTVLALMAVGADADMQNCSWKPGDNGTQCLSTANFGASCLSFDYYSAVRPRFCHMIKYPIYFGKGGAGLQDVQMLDDDARKAFTTSMAVREVGCCREVYRAHVCAEHFPRCWVDDEGTVNRMPPCRNWLCNAYQERTDVEKRIAGYLGKPCFSGTVQDLAGDPLCEGQIILAEDSNQEEEDINAPNCTCPLHNVTKNRDCSPFRYLVTWEDLAMLGQEPNQVVCEDHTPGISGASLLTVSHLLSGAFIALASSWYSRASLL